MADIIYYENFYTDNVFSAPLLNVFMNQLYTLLGNVFPVTEVEKHFVLDKEAALSLQGEDFDTIDQLAFTVTSESMYRFLRASTGLLNVEPEERFQKLYLRPFGFILSFELNLGPVQTLIIKNLTVRDKNDIKL